MSELLRTAILGTGQVSDASLEVAGSEADVLVEKLGLDERERALLLRAGSHATLRRAGQLPARQSLDLEPAPSESRPPVSPRLAALLAALLDGGEAAVLHESLERVARAGMRLSPDLLPKALGSGWALQAVVRPVLGERGRWLAAQRPEWAWALESSSTESSLPADLDQRWSEGTAAERKALLALVRRLAPARARQLVSDSWKQEKADQRLAWVEVLELNLGSEDEPLLASMLSDRSAQVRVAAARLLWRLPASELARRVRQRVDELLVVESATGALAKLKYFAKIGATRALRVTLPPDKYEAAWERDGIVEAAPHGGRRQFWLAQLVAAVPPAHWTQRTGLSPEEFVALASNTELDDSLLDGLCSAALRHRASEWYAPLWDAWTSTNRRPVVSDDPARELLVRLSPAEAEPRLVKLLAAHDGVRLLAHVPGPWPKNLAQLIVAGLGQLHREWTELLPHAALAIPVELLPAQVSPPVLPDENDYVARAYLRALERFQTIAALRQSVAREIAP